MDIGQRVQQFYNNTPFPDYELNRFNNKKELEVFTYPFARVLDRSIPKDASIVDVGTGTGQLSAFLSLRRENVWGIDFSDSSLGKASALKQKLNLDSWHLKKIDILDNEKIEAIKIKFDYVLCLGVLHHTKDPYQGFKNILKLLKPGGYIAVGLYNRFGRIPLNIRKILVKTVFKNSDLVKDYFIKMQLGEVKDKERARGWWNDQYLHPHETTHMLGQVLKWFKKNNIEFYQTIPSSTPFNQDCLEIAGVWNNYREPYPFLPIRLYKQVMWIWKTHREGGYWISFGRHKG